MKKLILLFWLISLASFGQDGEPLSKKEERKLKKGFNKSSFIKDIFKYSTFYGGYSETNSIQGMPTFYVTQENELIETTRRTPADFMITYGWRKLANFQYEDRNKFYDGSENNVSTRSSIGNVTGLEYLFEWQNGRQQGQEFTNKEAFLRYLSKWWLIKGEYKVNELVDLDYISAEARLRIPLGKKLSLSFGGIYRTYNKAYGHNPIQKYLEDFPWWSLAYDFAGHTDSLYEMVDPWTGESLGYDYQWFNQAGDLIASSDADYRNSVFQRVVNNYNRTELSTIGGYEQLSAVAGVDFYHYRKNFWIHFYGSVLPLHKTISGDERYSYENFVDSNEWIDYSAGGVFGFRISKALGVYTEVTLQRYWGRDLKAIKTGINIKL